MSSQALKWSHTVAGLKPAPRVVLGVLCQFHTMEKGCFPSQAKIAIEAKLSLSSVNKYLKVLEAMGHVRRERTRHPRTHRQRPTRYILAFEQGLSPAGDSDPDRNAASRPDSGFASNPTPEIAESRLRNSENILSDKTKNLTPRARAAVLPRDPRVCLEHYLILADGPAPDVSWGALTSFQKQAIALGESPQAIRRQRQARYGFPAISRMIEQARGGRGIHVRLWPASALDLCSPVKRNSPEAKEWEAEHGRRGWPWFDREFGGDTVYVPRGGVQGLDAFLLRLRTIADE